MARTVELELNRETVGFIIDKAHEFQVGQGAAIPDEPVAPAGEWEGGAVAPDQVNPAVAELRSTVDDLEPDQQVMLVALMWVGRGDYSVDEWQDALNHAKDSWNNRTADYLLGTPMLADYLAEGLEQFA